MRIIALKYSNKPYLPIINFCLGKVSTLSPFEPVSSLLYHRIQLAELLLVLLRQQGAQCPAILRVLPNAMYHRVVNQQVKQYCGDDIEGNEQVLVYVHVGLSSCEVVFIHF